MDDVVNRFAKELADAIAAAVADNPEVEACRERARTAGYEMKVTLEAVVGFVVRAQEKEKTTALATTAARLEGAGAAQGRGDDCQRSALPAVAPHRRGRGEGRGDGSTGVRNQESGPGIRNVERPASRRPFVFWSVCPNA